MKVRLVFLSLGAVFAAQVAQADLLTNGNLDKTYQQEIVSGFFLPKPQAWVNEGTRSITGPYEDEMSSEEWAGPSPTPVTTDGILDGVSNGKDYGVFFKPFSGNATNGLATGHLYQDVAGTAGMVYTMTGWAGAEANAMMQGAEFAIEFRNAAGGLLGSVVFDLMPSLFEVNGQPFNYKFHSFGGVAPAGTASVRARASMIGAQSNPNGGGQAFVIDDFTLTAAVPEPGTIAALGLGAAALLRRRRRSK